MEQNLQNTISLLERTPAALNALLRDLPDEWTLRDEGENTWNVFGVVGHLVYLEHTDWMTRVKRILESGETRPFERVDRGGHVRESKGKQLNQLLDAFAHARAENLTSLSALNLSEKDLDRTGRHPVLGVVTLSQLLAAWASHDMTHLHQISRIMAHQYREATGPWVKFLGVLQCGGHSAPA